MEGSLKKVARSRSLCCAMMFNPFVSQGFLADGREDGESAEIMECTGTDATAGDSLKVDK